MTKRNFIQVALLGGLLLGAFTATRAEVRLPSIFGSNMVLQRDKPVPVWGWADPGEKITVAIAGQSVSTEAGADGKWRLELAPLAVRETGDMTVAGNNVVTFKNVAVGEVWFCSGQSNMATYLLGQGEAAVESATDPQLRLYRVTSLLSAHPLETRAGLNWQPSTPKSARQFSAQAHFFGRALRKELNVPVGLIAAAIGGSRIEPWIPTEVNAATPALAQAIARITQLNTEYLDELEKTVVSKEWIQEARRCVAERKALPLLPALTEDQVKALPVSKLTTNKQLPSTLYNGLVHHLVGFPIRGVVWQQGSSNMADGDLYIPKMKALVDFWRRSWGAEIPFYYVQYASSPQMKPEFFEMQTALLQAIPNSAMAISNDVSYELDLHPRNKDVMGARLGLLALANTYGVKMDAFTGPIYKSMSVEGSKIRVTFDHVGSELKARNGKELTWFEIAGVEGGYVKAQAEIDGNDVLVWSPEVASPAKVRLGWSAIAQPNLMNNAGLPASMFRTHRE